MEIRTLALGACLALASVTAGAEVYKWTDENGKTHYGDRKPENQTAQQLNVRSGQPSQPSLMAPVAEASDAAGQVAGNSALKKEEEREQKRRSNCETARNNLQTIRDNARIRITEGEEQRYLTTEEINEKREEMQRLVERTCDGDAGAADAGSAN